MGDTVALGVSAIPVVRVAVVVPVEEMELVIKETGNV